MNSYRESEIALTHPASTSPRFSRRNLAISCFKRLRWCGLMSATSGGSLAREISEASSNLARYVTMHDVTAAMVRRERIAGYLRRAGVPEVGIFWFIQEP